MQFAIIIQGQIGNMYKFLNETLKIYKKIFPDTLIIISTAFGATPTIIKFIKPLLY